MSGQFSGGVVVDHTALEVPGANQKVFPAQNQSIGHPESWHRGNDMVNVTVTSAWQRFIWAPYVDRAQWKAGPYFRSLFMELIMSTMLAWLVSTVASIATDATVAINALSIGLAHGLFIAVAYSWRHTAHLPRHLNPGITFAEIAHQRSGIVYGFPQMAMQVAGSFIAAAILGATGGSAIPNYAAALRPVAFAGAFVLEIFLSFWPIFAYLHNMPVDLHASKLYEEASSATNHLHRVAIFVGVSIMVVTFIGLPNGLYTFNWVNYLGPAVNAPGGFAVPTSASWTIYVFAPIVGGVIAWAIHLLTWNMNGLSREELVEYVATERARRAMGAMAVRTFVASKGTV